MNLHRQLAKTLHVKSGIPLSSFLAADITDPNFARAFNAMRNEDYDGETQVCYWLIECGQIFGGRPERTVLGLVYCPYDDALRTALCMEPAYHAYLRYLRSPLHGEARPRDAWITLTPLDAAIASEDAIQLSIDSKEKDRTLYFDEWVQTKRELPVSRRHEFFEDCPDYISMFVYGPEGADVVALAHNSHTDDITVQYGNLVFSDNIEADVEAVAYKLYLTIRQELTEEDLAEYFPRFGTVRKRP